MDFMALNEIFSEEFNIDGIVALRQNRSASRHNWMEVGRHTNGLFLITDYPAFYELEDGYRFKAEIGDILLMSKGTKYSVEFPVPEGKRTHPMMINFRLTDTDGKELILPRGVFKLMQDDGSFLQLFSNATQLYKNSSAIMLKAKVYEIIGNIFPIEPSDECSIAYINRHYTRNFSIPYLAERCAMSETAYRKRFKEITGLSPIQYINHLKIEKACELIKSGELNASDICGFLNFDSLSYFYRVFKGITGVTPKEYKERMMLSRNTKI